MTIRFRIAVIGALLALMAVGGPVFAQDDATEGTAGAYESAELRFAYPEEGWALNEGAGVVRLEDNGSSIIVYGPTSYESVLGEALFSNDNAEALSFFLERVGYTVADASDANFANIATLLVELPRRDQAGFASLLDLGFDRLGVLISLSEETVDVDLDAAARIVAESIEYPPNIVDVAASTDDFSTLVAAVEAAGLADTLASGEFTVFAPTNAAFAQALDALGLAAEDLLADTETLTNILLYHVVEGSVLSSDLEAGDVPTLLEGESLTISLTDGVMVNAASVTQADIQASNGVIHVIDAVLLPPVGDVEGDPPPESEPESPEQEPESESDEDATGEAATPEPEPAQPTIVEAVIADRSFSLLEEAVVAADLADALSAEGPFTVFAPTNRAFLAAFADLGLSADDIAQQGDLLRDILLYHVVEGAVFSSDLADGDVNTLLGEPVTISLADSPTVNGANIVQTDTEVANGVIHVIDAVLVPQSVLDAMAAMQAQTTADASFEGDFSFSYPEQWTLEEGTDIVSLTLESAAILVSGPDNYNTIIGDVTTDSAEEQLALFLERSGYVPAGPVEADGTLAALEVTLPRRDQRGVAALYDLNYGRQGVIVGLAQDDPFADAMAFAFIAVADSLTYPPNIADIVIEGEAFSFLEEAVVAAGLAETLAGDGPFTVFAPSNMAFVETLTMASLDLNTLTDNPDLLASILLYHVVEGSVLSSDLTEGAVTTLNGADVTVSLDDGVMVNAASVTQADIEVSNGVIHVIDGLLLPPEALDAIALLQSTDGAEASYEGAFSFSYPDEYTLSEGSDLVTLALAGNRVLVSGPDNYATIIGDVSFDDAADELAFFLDRSGYTVGDPADVSDAEAAFDVELPRRDQSGLAALYDLGFGRSGVVVALSDAAEGPGVAARDFAFGSVANSLVYPPNVADLIADADDLSLLEAALDAADLTATLADGGPFTVFAPTNAALTAAVESLGLTVDDLVGNTDLLTAILQYHVVEGAVLSSDLSAGPVTTLLGEDVTVSLDAGVMVNAANVIEADIEASNGVIHKIDGVLIPQAAVAILAAAETASAEPVSYEGDFSFDYPETFSLTEGNDIVTLTLQGATVLVSGPDNYGTIIGDLTFATPAEELAFFLMRSGYMVGEAAETEAEDALAAYNITLERRNQSGVATLYDLNFGRVGVVVELSTDDNIAPAAQVTASTVADSLTYPPNVADLVTSTEDLSLLAAAVEAAGLGETLATGGPFTVFAPTNAALTAAVQALGVTVDDLVGDTELLTQILQYHVVEGAVLSSDLSAGPVTTLLGEAVTISLDDGVMVNAANVIEADIEASNGVVHIIDGVLLPLGLTLEADTTFSDSYTFDYASAYELSEGTGLVTLTEGDNRILVSGPANYTNIIGAVQQPTLDAQLRFFLERSGYTVADATVYPGAAAAFNVELPRRMEQGVAALVDLGLNQRGVVIALSDNPDNTGLVANTGFVVNSLRLPTIAEIASANPTFSTLAAAVDAAGLQATLNDRDAEFTVFAPTDAAFDALLQGLGLSSDELLADSDLLATVLQYHTLGAALESSVIATTLDGREIPTLLTGEFMGFSVGEDGSVLINDVVPVTQADIYADNGVVHVIEEVLLPPSIALAVGAPGQCVVSTPNAETVLVRVGPGFNRTQIDFLPADTPLTVLGLSQDDNGNVWYQVDRELAAPGKDIEEAWVLSTNVERSAGCPVAQQ